MIYSFIERVERQMEDMLDGEDFVCISDGATLKYMFGDRRAADQVWVSSVSQCIVVRERDDRTLQYYGGFEYVDKQYRKEIGSYVIYFGMHERVADAVDAAIEAV